MQQSGMTKTHTYKKHMDDKHNSSVASSSTTYGMPLPTDSNTAARLAQIDNMKEFLQTATQHWEPNKALRRFPLPPGEGAGSSGGESISCVLWDNLFFITGTDIVRSLTFRFHAFGRPVTNAKKFEEGIFSDLRNLKPGHDARLEEPKSELLDMLYKNNCIRTQKKQKVFFWFSVPHDRLFLDALERDLKREKMGMEPTTQAVAEPASSLSLDSTQELFDQLRKSISQSAAATAQAIEEEIVSASNSTSNAPVPNSSLSLGSIHQINDHSNFLDTDQSWPTSPTPNSAVSHTPWSVSQSRLERAASQSKRSRVNSVPAKIGQKQQLQLLQQQQQQKSHRMSYSSYFHGNSISTSMTASRRPHGNNRRISSNCSSMLSSPTTTATADDFLFRDDSSNSTATTATVDMSLKSSNLSSPLIKYHHMQPQHDYMMDPISNGVNQLEITPSLSNTSHSTSTSSSILQHNSNIVLPSKSLDSNAMKKTKAIFGNLNIFEGSPTYKQRRRRAASVSTSNLNQQHHLLHGHAGGPDRVGRRHDKCHLPTPPSSNIMAGSSSKMVNSRLAMAAAKAGFSANQIMSTPQPMLLPTNRSQSWRQPGVSVAQLPQQQDFYCPVADCRHLFKRPEHLERHMQSLHMFSCTVCGKQFPGADYLAQHHRLEHEIQQYDHISSLSGGDNNHDDDSSSPDDYQRNFMFSNYGRQQQNQHHQQVLSHNQQQNDNRYSFDGSRSSGWSTNISANGSASNNSSHNSSRCSTLSPMLDLDFDMPDVQPTANTATATFQPTVSLSSSRSNTSLTTTESSSVMLNERQQQQQMFSSPYYPEPSQNAFSKEESNWSNGTAVAASAARKGSSSFEDDFSSSSASSPCSTLQYNNSNSTDPFNQSIKLESNASTSTLNIPMTLLSPFKPTPLQQQQQHQQQQQLQDEHHLLQMANLNDSYQNYHEQQPQFDVNMDSMFPNAPLNDNSDVYQSLYAPYDDQQYSPFTSPDNMNIVFGA
ncbi:hypothetical protein [Parasitella parasitica]|uniref:C2H2-type domain-containing protein n=1 Tax=Parasitella parasitica TaxID=35722 RepID=A0A0B7N3Z5_9FUNG|nr:hypothetical protein [Parasitella parasitica]